MQPEHAPRPTFSPAGAGGVLIGTVGAAIVLGALIGWALGSWAYGVLVGAILGIPLGILMVYRRYRGYFT
jgi:hypothetical protein